MKTMNAVKYSAINAKLKGMYANHFKQEDFEELLKQADVKSAISYLKQKIDNLKDVNEDASRLELELQLEANLIGDIKKIRRLLGDQEKELFQMYYLIYEFQCLKSIIRNLNTNAKLESKLEIANLWMNEMFSDIEALMHVQDMHQFFKGIETREYSTIFQEYEETNKDIENVSIFEIENKLDKYYFESLYEVAMHYDETLQDMIGKEIDLMNILWTFRTKQYYQFSEEKVKQILIDKRYKLTSEQWKALPKIQTFEELKEVLEMSAYASVIGDMENVLEDRIDSYLCKVYQKYFIKQEFQIATVVAYMKLKEKEKNEILNLVEGIRYHIDKKELQKKIISETRVVKNEWLLKK